MTPMAKKQQDDQEQKAAAENPDPESTEPAPQPRSDQEQEPRDRVEAIERPGALRIRLNHASRERGARLPK